MKNLIKHIFKKNEHKRADMLSNKSAGVVGNFHQQVVEIENINTEIASQVEEINKKIDDLTETRDRLLVMHEKNTKVQSSIKGLVSWDVEDKN